MVYPAVEEKIIVSGTGLKKIRQIGLGKNMNKNIFAVIMAGGQGERFWPGSRRDKPKQLLNLVSSVTMIEETMARLTHLIPPENIIVMTGAKLVPSIQSLLPELPAENIIGESVGRNTAPCLAAACGVINNRTNFAPDAVMLVMPSDHLIEPVEDFIVTLENIIRSLDNHPDFVYTIGIKPTFPSTGYGYIKCGSATENPEILHGESFVEKPALPLAQEFVAAGNYFWNGGMFIWRTGTLMAALKKYAAELSELADMAAGADGEGRMEQFMNEKYPAAKSISIDYAIMEKVGSFMVAAGNFSWDDIGSWSALGSHFGKDADNNAVRGNFVGESVHNCVIYNDDPEHLLAGIDLNSMMLIHAGNATLAAPLSSDQKVRDIVKQLKNNEKNQKFL